jgi:CheY-like chemotaxis protein/anti-sigma regulatory factor (Ser/Thr protein kinase)
VEIQTNIQADCDPVLADATCVHQIFMNLCTNAYQAMGSDGGRLTVRITEVTLGDELIHAGAELHPGQYVRLDVSDTGHGMDRETAQRIFEPYFTTKGRGQGTGLGLATVHGIVTDLNGAIVVYSEPGSGSTFTVFLPAVAAEVADGGRPKKTLDGMPGSERVLFVDDERPLRLMAERALGRLGYRVTAVGNPKEALALLEADPQAFDVVITDEMMPGMRGTELLAAVRALRPSLPVILYSGFSESLRSNPRGAEAFDGHVMKPMVVSELSLAIREALLHPRGA